MTIYRVAVLLCCLELFALMHRLHAQAKPEAIAVTTLEMNWGAQSGLAMAGMAQANLVGDPTKPGPYNLLEISRWLQTGATFASGQSRGDDTFQHLVHGYGEKFDEHTLKALPAGSFYSEPANVAHFVEVREPVVIQVSSTGPSGRVFVKPADNTR
jgi:hypothetical protein